MDDEFGEFFFALFVCGEGAALSFSPAAADAMNSFMSVWIWGSLVYSFFGLPHFVPGGGGEEVFFVRAALACAKACGVAVFEERVDWAGGGARLWLVRGGTAGGGGRSGGGGIGGPCGRRWGRCGRCEVVEVARALDGRCGWVGGLCARGGGGERAYGFVGYAEGVGGAVGWGAAGMAKDEVGDAGQVGQQRERGAEVAVFFYPSGGEQQSQCCRGEEDVKQANVGDCPVYYDADYF